FHRFKTPPQYPQPNRGMKRAEFKTIFWWEWSHRLLGRVIGVAYLLPFLWFLWRGGLGSELKRRLWGVFALGALLAGPRPGKIYNTWPDIDGGFIPSAARLFFDVPWWRNLFENTLTVQFEHRMVAYILLALAVVHAIDAARSRAG